MRPRDKCSYEEAREAVSLPEAGTTKKNFACSLFEADDGYEYGVEEVIEKNLGKLKNDLSMKDAEFFDSCPIFNESKLVGKKDEYKVDGEIDWSTGEILAVGDRQHFDPLIEESEYSIPVDLWVSVIDSRFHSGEDKLRFELRVTTPLSEPDPIEALLDGHAMDNLNISFSRFTGQTVDG